MFAGPERRSEETEGGDGRWRRRVEQLMYVGRLERALQLYIYIYTHDRRTVCVCVPVRAFPKESPVAAREVRSTATHLDPVL